jgi:hypothetical protein
MLVVKGPPGAPLPAAHVVAGREQATTSPWSMSGSACSREADMGSEGQATMIVPLEGGTPLLQARCEQRTMRAGRKSDRASSHTRGFGTFVSRVRA